MLWNTGRLVIYLLAFFLTPLLAIPLGKLFDPVTLSDWWKSGALRGFYTGLITGFLWLGEFIGLFFLDKFLQKKFNVQIDPEKPKKAKKGEVTETAAAPKTEQPEQEQEAAATTAAHDTETCEHCGKKTKRWTERTDGLLGWDRMIAIFAICVACVLIISAQIGFQVKVFYELGEKATLIEIINFSGGAGKNIAKCGWIVLLIKCLFGIFEGLFNRPNVKPQAQKILAYVCVTLAMVAFGLYDVLSSQNPFVWTYLLFYAAFVAIYALIKRAPIKSYLLILFIYFF